MPEASSCPRMRNVLNSRSVGPSPARALSAAELVDHYRRGALSAKFQIASCPDAACASDLVAAADTRRPMVSATRHHKLTFTVAGLSSA